MLQWHLAPFEELSPRDVHDIFQARAAVFVVEQACAFQDVDGADPASWHLVGRDGERRLLAYCRLVPPGVKYEEPSIGRVVTLPPVRGVGAGKELMAEALRGCASLWPGRAVRIGAQARLEAFYNGFGFVRDSEPYIEDGIPHIEMVRGPGPE